MKVIIQPSKIAGEIIAPASKSSMQRACAAALIKNGESIIRNPGKSNDDKSAVNIIKSLGAIINEQEDGSLQIISKGVKPVTDKINCGESGLGIRMFTPIIALSEKQITIEGEGSLLNRPMNFFDEILPQLNIKSSSNNGKLPIVINGSLQPKNIEIDGSLSSQFLTGLLFAFSAADAKGVTIKVNNLKSKPYVDLTLKMMEDFLLKVPENRNYKEFYFEETPLNSNSLFVDYTVEGDWSGGAFLLVAGAIAGNIIVNGLDIASTQADKKILKALEDCGADISFQHNAIQISCSPSGLTAFHFNATDCPDLFPPLVSLAAYCKGTTVIEGVHRLTHKESNRALTLQKEFGKMGVEIILRDDKMLIKGSKIKSATVHSNHDHRIAMACAVAVLRAEGEVVIENAEAINKSYPGFYNDLQKIGAEIK